MTAWTGAELAVLLAGALDGRTFVDLAGDVPGRSVEAVSLAARRFGIRFQPRRRIRTPNTPQCGKVWHYNTGCGSDACREAARRHRARFRRGDRLPPAAPIDRLDEFDADDRSRIVMASLGIPT